MVLKYCKMKVIARKLKQVVAEDNMRGGGGVRSWYRSRLMSPGDIRVTPGYCIVIYNSGLV